MATVPQAHIGTFLAVTFVPEVNNASFNSISRNAYPNILKKNESLKIIQIFDEGMDLHENRNNILKVLHLGSF